MRFALLLLLSALASTAQAPPTAPSLQNIVSRLETMNNARTAALLAYKGTRIYDVSYKGFPETLSAKAVVKLDFIAPDKKQFTIVSQQGSGLLVNRVIRRALESEQEALRPEFRTRSALNETNYDFKLIGNDAENGRPCYLLEVMPKRSDKYLYDGRICVDTVDYAVVRIDAKPAKNPSFWISRAHINSLSRKHGDFWLPATTRSTSHVRLGGDATLDIDYTDYQIINASRLP